MGLLHGTNLITNVTLPATLSVPLTEVLTDTGIGKYYGADGSVFTASSPLSLQIGSNGHQFIGTTQAIGKIRKISLATTTPVTYGTDLQGYVQTVTQIMWPNGYVLATALAQRNLVLTASPILGANASSILIGAV